MFLYCPKKHVVNFSASKLGRAPQHGRVFRIINFPLRSGWSRISVVEMLMYTTRKSEITCNFWLGYKLKGFEQRNLFARCVESSRYEGLAFMELQSPKYLLDVWTRWWNVVILNLCSPCGVVWVWSLTCALWICCLFCSCIIFRCVYIDLLIHVYCTPHCCLGVDLPCSTPHKIQLFGLGESCLDSTFIWTFCFHFHCIHLFCSYKITLGFLDTVDSTRFNLEFGKQLASKGDLWLE